MQHAAAKHTQQENSEDILALFGLLTKISKVTETTQNFEAWISGFMEAVCNHYGWVIGHSYVSPEEGEDKLSSQKIWHIDTSQDTTEFCTMSEGLEFESGVGLPGRVLESGQADWIFDVTQDENYPRRHVAAKIGLKGGYAFPVIVKDRVAAVVEFYGTLPAEPDQTLIEVLRYLGLQAGPVMERGLRKKEMEKLANMLDEDVAGMVEKISQKCNQIEQTMHQARQTAQQAKNNSGEVAGAAKQASENVAAVAAATEELTSSIQSIEESIQSSRQSTDTVMTRVELSRKNVHSLTDSVSQIGNIAQFTRNIADQTKLLALNATIESARAGEAGRGFAVVANEVKKLANDTLTSTDGISERIQAIQEAINQVAGDFGELENFASHLNNSITSMQNTIEQQSEATVEIAQSASASATSSDKAHEQVDGIAATVIDIDTMASHVFDSVQDMAGEVATLEKKVHDFIVKMGA